MARRRFQDIICITEGPFKPGDQPPEGYGDWIEWAEVQHRAGLRQVRRACGRFHFPQEVCPHATEK